MQFDPEPDLEYDEDNLSFEESDYPAGSGGLSDTTTSKSRRRKKWEPHEDAQLLRLIKKCGTKNWRALALHMKGRLPKQCRERWINHLDPNITKGKLTDEEWQIVLNCHRELGNRWSEIAKFLPGRTPNQIKNHWHAKVRKGTKRPREGSSVSGEESANSDSEESSSPIATKKRKYTVYDSPPSSPVDGEKKAISNMRYRGTWSDFEALLEMVEITYKQEVASSKHTVITSPPPRTPVQPITALPFIPPLSPLTSIPHYDLGLAPYTSIPAIIAPSYGHPWHTTM